MREKIKNQYLVLIFLLIAFHLLNNIYFLSQDNVPFASDLYNKQLNSVNNYYNLINESPVYIFHQLIFFNDAPLSSYPAFLLYPFFGKSEDVTAFSGTIFLIILIIATYLLGKELFNKDIGLLSAVLVSFSPYFLGLSKVPFEDITFAAIFTLTLYFFLESNKFSDIKYTWFFNISLALTLFSKVAAILAISIIILIYSISKLFFNKKDFKNFFNKLKKGNIRNFFISFFLSMSFPLCFYIFNISLRLKEIYYSHEMQTISFDFSNFIYTILEYIKIFNLNFEYLFIFVIFIISFVFFLIFSRKYKIFILSTIIGANLYYIILIYFFPYYQVEIHRLLAFIRPIYFVIISLFLVKLIYNFKSKLLKIKISKERLFSFLVISLIILLIPFTLYYNYHNDENKPLSFFPSLGKYQPINCFFDVDEVALHFVESSKDLKIFIFSWDYFYIDFFYTRISHLNSERINELVYILDKDKDLQIRKKYPPTSKEYDDYYEYLIEDGYFHFENMTDFDFIIVLKNDDIFDTKFNEYNEVLIDYLSNNTEKFITFKKIKICDDKQTLFVYKNRMLK
jgi:hypothetical protein